MRSLRKPSRIPIIIASLLLFSNAMPSIAASANALLPDEALTSQEIDRALESMTAEERHGREPAFRDRSRPVVAYTRQGYRFDHAQDGTVSVVTTAASSADLVLTVSVAWERDCPIQLAVCWLVTDFWQWRNVALDTSGQDKLGTAWNNNMAVSGASAVGYYRDNSFITFSNRVYQAGTGTGVGFNEWKLSGLYYAYYGWDYVTIGYSSRRYTTTNVVFTYFHTWQAQNYTLGFSAIGPTVTISPATSEWSLSATPAVFTN